MESHSVIEKVSASLGQVGLSEFAIGTDFEGIAPTAFKTTFPGEWQAKYFEEEMIYRDPVCWSGAFSKTPVWWRDIQPRNQVMRDARQFGIYADRKPGIVIPIYRDNKKLVISTVSQSLTDITVEDINQLVVEFADHLFEDDGLEERPKIKLSEQQKAMLWLKSEGYTYLDISKFLRVNKWTVNDCLDRARAELGAKDTVHAVSQAIRRNIIS